MKLLAITIIYHPEINELTKNIQQYINYVEKLIIWDNSPTEISKQLLKKQYPDKILYKTTEKNEYIAHPLNFALHYGIKNKYTHLLTMDQDSYWENIQSFIFEIDKIKLSNILAYCPPIKNIYEFPHESIDFYELSECITSGTIYNLAICKELGDFREDFKIDAVDLEYCYRGQSRGYKTIMLRQGALNHHLGNPIKVYKWNSSNYSAIRTFYIIRNHFWTWKEYPSLFNKKQFLKKECLHRFIFILIGEKNKIKKLCALIKGIILGIIK